MVISYKGEYFLITFENNQKSGNFSQKVTYSSITYISVNKIYKKYVLVSFAV